MPLQAWPNDLPLISTEAAVDGTSVDRLDMGVIMFSCSFAVILLMILSQVESGMQPIIYLLQCKSYKAIEIFG
jgi:hypothetical protein